MALASYFTSMFFYCFINCCVQGASFLGDKNTKVEEPLPLSRAGERLIRDVLFRASGTVFKSENQELNLNCKNKARDYLLKEFQNSEIRWKHNSENFVLDPSRMTYKFNSLYIQTLKATDSGVFTCQVNVGPSRYYVVGMTVVVVSYKDIKVLPGASFTLDCNSKQLGLLYKDAIRFWEQNGKTVQDTKLAAVKTLKTVSIAELTGAGNWTCSVYSEASQKLWVTAKYRVTIAPVPPIMTRVRIYAKNNKIKSGLILMGCTFVLVTLMNFIMRVLERNERKRQKEIEQLKKMLGIEPKDTELQF